MVGAAVDLVVVGEVDIAGVQRQHLAAGVDDERGLVRVLVRQAAAARRIVLAAQQHIGRRTRPVRAEDRVAGAGHEDRGAEIRLLCRHAVVVECDGVHLGVFAGVEPAAVVLPVPAVHPAVGLDARQIMAVKVVQVRIVDIGPPPRRQAQGQRPVVHLADLLVGQQVRPTQPPQRQRIGQVHIGGVAAVERPLGKAAVRRLDLEVQRAPHHVQGPLGPLRRRRTAAAFVVAQRQRRQPQAAVGPQVPVVDMRRLVQRETQRENARTDLDRDAVVQPVGLFGQDGADGIQRRRVVGRQPAVQHIVGLGVMRHRLALDMRLAQVAAARRELHIGQNRGRRRRVARAVGQHIGEGQALGPTRLVALGRKGGGHIVGARQHGGPPAAVGRALHPLFERGNIRCFKQKGRMYLGGLGRQDSSPKQQCQTYNTNNAHRPSSPKLPLPRQSRIPTDSQTPTPSISAVRNKGPG